MKKDVPIITDSFKNFAESVLNIDLNLVKQSGSWVNYAKRIGNTDKELLKFLSDVDSGNRKIEDIDNYMQSASSSASKFTASLKSVAANMAIMLAVNVAIKVASKLWDTLNITVEEQEEKISELSSSIETLQSEYNELSQKQDVTDAEKRRLEYLERRLELDERILKAEQAQLFDEKTGSKFTDLFDKDNLHTQYLGEMNYRNKDGYAGLKFKYDNRTEDITKVQDQISEWKKLQSTVEEGSKAWDEYQKRIDNAQNKETKYIDQLSEQENQLTINLGKYADNIEYLQSQLDSGNLTEDQTATAKEQLSQWQQMYDTVELMITEIQKLNGTYSSENKIKDILSQPEFEKTSKQLEELGKSGKLSVSDLYSTFPELIRQLDEAGISAKELYQYIMALSDADMDNPGAVNLDAQLHQAKQKFGGYSYNERGVEATNEAGRIFDDFWNEYVKTTEQANIVNSTEFQKALDKQIENLDNVTLSAENYGKALEEAQNKIAEASFGQAWENSFTSENEETQKLGDALLELAEKGRLTVDTFNEADSTEYFKNLGISADIAVSKINKMVDESKQLSSMSDQISRMSEALATKKENGFAEVDTLAGFAVEVRGLESWDRFQTVLGSTTSTYHECLEAANELATEWVNSNDFLVQLTEDTKEYYETQLEAMGIENYEEVIESTLALKEAKEALAEVDLSEASYEDIEILIQKGKYSALVTEQMWALYYAKLAESGTFLDSSADCAQLQALANDAMLTAEAVELLDQLIKIYNGLESGAYNKDRLARTEALAEAKRIEEEIRKLASGEGAGLIAKPELKVNGNKGKKSGGSSGGSGSSEGKHKEAYEKELKELERMHKLGLISDEDYWKARMDLNEKYFGESSGVHEKYLEEYQKNEEDILEGIKKLWEDYYDERKNNLKDLISYAEKLYDEEIDSLEANIKVLEEKRDTEKKQWQEKIDAIGNEIDALEDANDERERAIDLQNRQWALQKAMHQRTILLYSENGGMRYVNDSKAERDAKNDLDDAEHDNKVADLKKQQENLEIQLDAILETYDAQIEAIEKQIDSLKEVKSAWSEIVENQEFKELEERLKSLFGDDVREKILSGSTDFINSIVSQYSDTSDMLRTIQDAALADIQNMAAQYGILPENLMSITDALSDITNVMGNVDTSGFNTNLDNTAQTSANAAEKIQSTATALNNLSNEVSGYQLPELNSENFMSAFSEEGGILSALNGFMERYKEICNGIPEIWNNSLAEAFGQGGGNGDPLAGGLPNDTKYDALFEPLITALNNCRTNMEAKLKESLELFSTFQTDLSGIIGVASGGSEESGIPLPGAEGGKGNGSGVDKNSESEGGSGTIVGAIVEGGKQIDEALNGEENSWSASFLTAAGSIHGTASYIVECIESMVETIVNACIAAIDAINMLERAEGGSGNHPAPPPYSRVGHAHGEIGNAFADGTGLRRVPYDNPAYDIDRKFEAYMEKTGSNIDIITRSGLIRYDNDMGEVVKNVTNVSNVTNNNRNMQPVINIGDITVQGVQDVTGFARAIKTHFSNAMLQEMYKR